MATPATIATYLERLAPLAKVEVTGQTTIAGQDAYLLTMTPTATDTALGSVQAAIDGKTFVPLQLQVFAKDVTAPVIQFGFTTVSYDAIPASTFDFTPPAGATVTTKTTDLSKAMSGHSGTSTGTKTEPTTAQQSALQTALKQAFLTVPEAQKLVAYTLYSPQNYTARPFDMAAVVSQGGPLTAAGTPLSTLLEAAGIGGASGGASTTTPDRDPDGSDDGAHLRQGLRHDRPGRNEDHRGPRQAAQVPAGARRHDDGERRHGALAHYRARRRVHLAEGRHDAGGRRHGAQGRPPGVRQLRAVTWTTS